MTINFDSKPNTVYTSTYTHSPTYTPEIYSHKHKYNNNNNNNNNKIIRNLYSALFRICSNGLLT